MVADTAAFAYKCEVFLAVIATKDESGFAAILHLKGTLVGYRKERFPTPRENFYGEKIISGPGGSSVIQALGALLNVMSEKAIDRVDEVKKRAAAAYVGKAGMIEV